MTGSANAKKGHTCPHATTMKPLVPAAEGATRAALSRAETQQPHKYLRYRTEKNSNTKKAVAGGRREKKSSSLPHFFHPLTTCAWSPDIRPPRPTVPDVRRLPQRSREPPRKPQPGKNAPHSARLESFRHTARKHPTQKHIHDTRTHSTHEHNACACCKSDMTDRTDKRQERQDTYSLE